MASLKIYLSQDRADVGASVAIASVSSPLYFLPPGFSASIACRKTVTTRFCH